MPTSLHIEDWASLLVWACLSALAHQYPSLEQQPCPQGLEQQPSSSPSSELPSSLSPSPSMINSWGCLHLWPGMYFSSQLKHDPKLLFFFNSSKLNFLGTLLVVSLDDGDSSSFVWLNLFVVTKGSSLYGGL